MPDFIGPSWETLLTALNFNDAVTADHNPMSWNNTYVGHAAVPCLTSCIVADTLLSLLHGESYLSCNLHVPFGHRC